MLQIQQRLQQQLTASTLLSQLSNGNLTATIAAANAISAAANKSAATANKAKEQQQQQEEEEEEEEEYIGIEHFLEVQLEDIESDDNEDNKQVMNTSNKQQQDLDNSSSGNQSMMSDPPPPDDDSLTLSHFLKENNSGIKGSFANRKLIGRPNSINNPTVNR